MGSYDISELDCAYGRPEALRRIKEYRTQHSASLADAIEGLTRQLHAEPPPVTPDQIRTAILVLNASTAEQLGHIDPALLIELADAIDIAAYGPILCEIEIDPPVNLG